MDGEIEGNIERKYRGNYRRELYRMYEGRYREK